MVANCVFSRDTGFLHSLFAFLLASNNAELALRIDSVSLERWLLAEKKDDVDLLWKYYSFHGGDVRAGDIMKERARDNVARIHLGARIQCLARAANSYAAALDGSSPRRFVSSTSTLRRSSIAIPSVVGTQRQLSDKKATKQISSGPDNRPRNHFRGRKGRDQQHAGTSKQRNFVRVGEARAEAGRYEQE